MMCCSQGLAGQLRGLGREAEAAGGEDEGGAGEAAGGHGGAVEFRGEIPPGQRRGFLRKDEATGG